MCPRCEEMLMNRRWRRAVAEVRAGNGMGEGDRLEEKWKRVGGWGRGTEVGGNTGGRER